MKTLPPAVAAFLSARRVAVAGVSRSGTQPANLIWRRLRELGIDAVPLNPRVERVEGVACYPDLAAVPGEVDALMIVTPAAAGEALVRQAAARGIRKVWFHRSFGAGSVCETARQACAELGLDAIVGGCPMMYIEPVDPVHRCMRWWLARQGKAPA
jgi:predicted CoA-binding protein